MKVIESAKLRDILKIVIPFFLMPLFTLGGIFLLREKSWTFVSAVLAVLTVVLFYCGFERKQTGTRRMVLVSVLTALAVAGRFIFSPIPGFDPITALAVIAALYLGGEAGFMVGSLSALLSDFFAGMGAWTPFQMLAWGMTGLLAAGLAEHLKKSRVLLCVYGAAAGILFSLLMDIYSVIWYNGTFSPKLYAASILSALPFTAAYAASDVLFLLLLSKPFGEKLLRIKLKYGV